MKNIFCLCFSLEIHYFQITFFYRVSIKFIRQISINTSIYNHYFLTEIKCKLYFPAIYGLIESQLFLNQVACK